MTCIEDYIVPEIELQELVSGQVLCTSDPDDGSIEDIDYETW